MLERPLAEQILERIAVGILTIDRDFRIIQFNPYMVEHTGKKARDVIGRDLFECFTELPEAWLRQKLRGVILLKNYAYTSWQQRPYLFEMAHERTVVGGIDFMRQDVTFLPIRGDDGIVSAICITVYDRTEECILHSTAALANLKLAEALVRVEQLSQTDGLTGLLNRRTFDERVREALLRKQRYDTSSAILLLDLDHFKQVNDTYGHLCGDQALILVATRVRATIRDCDVFARYGGEEFALLLPEVDVKGGAILAERVRSEIAAKPLEYNTQSVNLTASIGVTELRSHHDRVELAYSEADAALYESKNRGRNCVTVYP